MRHVEQHEALGGRRARGEGGAGELSGQGDRETEGQRLKKHSSFEALRGSNQLNMLPHEEKISEKKGLRKESTRSCRVAQIKCKIARRTKGIGAAESIIPPMCDCTMELGKKLRSKKFTVERVRGERAGGRRNL